MLSIDQMSLFCLLPLLYPWHPDRNSRFSNEAWLYKTAADDTFCIYSPSVPARRIHQLISVQAPQEELCRASPLSFFTEPFYPFPETSSCQTDSFSYLFHQLRITALRSQQRIHTTPAFANCNATTPPQCKYPWIEDLLQHLAILPARRSRELCLPWVTLVLSLPRLNTHSSCFERLALHSPILDYRVYKSSELC